MPPPRDSSRRDQVGVRRTSSVRPISSSRPSPTRCRPRTGSLVAADRPGRHDRRSVHQGARRQAVAEGPRGRAPRQQRSDGARREDRPVHRRSSGSPSTPPARPARSFRPMRCRTLPANSMIRWDVHYWPFGEEVKDDVIELGIWLYPEDHKEKAKYKQDLEAVLAADEGRRARDSAARHGDDAGVPLLQDPGAHRQLPAARPRPAGRHDGRDLLSRRRASWR